jgi:type 1 fimbria pilin
MKGIIPLIVVLACAASGVLAQEKKPEIGTVTLNGYVIDAMCGAAWAKKANGAEKAIKHTKACALNEHCSAAGYGMFSEGAWVKFDTVGDQQAKAAIQKSKKERGHYFEVKGSWRGSILQVVSMKEIPEKK